MDCKIAASSLGIKKVSRKIIDEPNYIQDLQDISLLQFASIYKMPKLSLPLCSSFTESIMRVAEDSMLWAEKRRWD